MVSQDSPVPGIVGTVVMFAPAALCASRGEVEGHRRGRGDSPPGLEPSGGEAILALIASGMVVMGVLLLVASLPSDRA